MTLRFKWFSRMVPPGFKLVYSFTGWPRPGWSLWSRGECLAEDCPVRLLRADAWLRHYSAQPFPEVQE